MEVLQMEHKILAGISYLIWPLCLLVILTNLKKIRFLRFHAYQTLFLGLVGFVLYLVVGAFLGLIPVVGGILLKIAVVLWISFQIYFFYCCLQGEYFKIPLIYDLAQGNME